MGNLKLRGPILKIRGLSTLRVGLTFSQHRSAAFSNLDEPIAETNIITNGFFESDSRANGNSRALCSFSVCRVISRPGDVGSSSTVKFLSASVD